MRELGGRERLLHVRVGAGLVAAAHVRLLRLRRQQEHLRPAQRLVGADLPEHLQAVEPGHADVEHRERRLALRARARAPRRRGSPATTSKPVAPQARRHEQEDVVVVVCDEDQRARSRGNASPDARGQLDPEDGTAAVARRRARSCRRAPR